MPKAADDVLQELIDILVKDAAQVIAEEAQTNILQKDAKEHLDSVTESEKPQDAPCVCDARVICTQASEASHPVHIKTQEGLVHISDITELGEKDIELEENFEGCKGARDLKCYIVENYKEWIQDGVWKAAADADEVGEGQHTLSWQDSYMICEKGPGMVYFQNPGQKIKDRMDILMYEAELRMAGFPDGYIKYLLPLHEKYPKWKFEAVITNVDYEEFYMYQIDNELKCADYDSNPNYCTTKRFKIENMYYVAAKEAVIYFSNPYSLLQTGEGKCNNAVQFLKADQELPEDYVNKIFSILRDEKDTDICNAIQNSESCMNPVFMASLWSAENGPAGEIYKGQKVYNLFNVGADGGAEDSKEYAYQKGWFSAEACIKGSEETLKGYIDRGQNTLYALDWDYLSYGTVNMHQYAALVNDAEDKALQLTKKGDDVFDLDYELTLSIPVYENIPSYSDEEDYVAYPDPNWVN